MYKLYARKVGRVGFWSQRNEHLGTRLLSGAVKLPTSEIFGQPRVERRFLSYEHNLRNTSHQDKKLHISCIDGGTVIHPVFFIDTPTDDT
jgi:hypothetical protein